MSFKKYTGIAVAGICAGAVNGLFGAGGGMVLVPLLTWLSTLEDREIFPASVCIILPICVVSLLLTYPSANVSVSTIVQYMIASAAGGILAGIIGKKIPTAWLHKLLGVLILWGGVRYLC
ncbi:MAG: sulfite exporter TauE/SafE family protein [Oscillospiraceae bacterium]|nr:sulfite exporter TauE/SafE family protein [Oscillospiraceae bacterium]